jgi:hypothetical protein
VLLFGGAMALDKVAPIGGDSDRHGDVILTPAGR